MYSQEVLEDLRQGNDIVEVISGYVSLTQKGSSHMGLCPFHREKTPSFSVSAIGQFFHCFGCGEGGNVFGFIMKIENLSFVDAVKFLADRINYNLPIGNRASASSATLDEKNRIYDVNKLAARFYYDVLQGSKGQPARAYLKHRKINDNIERRFGLGYSAGGLRDFLLAKGYDDAVMLKAGLISQGERGYYDRFRSRLMFPIFDVQGKVTGFGGRIIGEGEPKYLNSPKTPVFDKSRTLYGLNYAMLTKKRTLILVEGYMDVIALYQAGIKNVVAALGTALTANHARLLKRYCDEAVILFDSDEAGIKAALRSLPHLYEAGLGIRVVQLDKAKDPDDFIQNFGIAALGEELNKARDFVDFQIGITQRGLDLNKTAERISFQKEAAKIISNLKSPVEREAYAKDMSAKYKMDEPSLKEEIKILLGNSGGEEGIKGTEGIENTITITQNRKPRQAHKEAVSHILWTMASDKELYGQIAAHLTGEEFMDNTCKQIFGIIVSERKKGKEPKLPDIMTHFEEQQKVADIFASIPKYDTDKDQRAALSDHITHIKDEYLIEQIYAATDTDTKNSLAFERNRLKTQKIRF